jgi:hypothetical protein
MLLVQNIRQAITTTDSTLFSVGAGAGCASTPWLNTVNMADAEQPSISFCTRLFMESPYVLLF